MKAASLCQRMCLVVCQRMRLVEIFDHPALAGLYDISPVVAMNIAIFTQRRRFAIDRLREFLDLDGIRHALTPADFDPRRGAAAGGASLG